MAYTPGWNPDKQARIAREASNQGQLDGPLPLISMGDMPVGNSALDTRRPYAFLRPPYRLATYDSTSGGGLLPELLGQDALVIGQQFTGPAPSGTRRASALSEPGANLTVLISQAAPVIPQGLSSGLSDLPPRGSLRARDYSIAAGFPLELVGKDQLFGTPGEVPAYDWSYLPPKPRYQQGTGEPVQDLLGTLLQVAANPPAGVQVFEVPRAAQRLRDYSWTWQLDLVLLGQDIVNPGVQVFEVPRGAARARDYSFLASFPLELIGLDAMAKGQQLTALPFPTGPVRARDYSLAAGFPLELIGKDATLAGDQYTDLVPRRAARLNDYSHLATYALPNSTTRDLIFEVGPPASRWRTWAPVSAWTSDQPEHKWQLMPPQE